jgi:hypothetical protein
MFWEHHANFLSKHHGKVLSKHHGKFGGDVSSLAATFRRFKSIWRLWKTTFKYVIISIKVTNIKKQPRTQALSTTRLARSGKSLGTRLIKKSF